MTPHPDLSKQLEEILEGVRTGLCETCNHDLDYHKWEGGNYCAVKDCSCLAPVLALTEQEQLDRILDLIHQREREARIDELEQVQADHDGSGAFYHRIIESSLATLKQEEEK